MFSRIRYFLKRIIPFVFLLLTCYFITLLFLLCFENKLVFRPNNVTTFRIDPSSSQTFQDIFLEDSQGQTIHAKWFPYTNAESTVLFCHQNNANLSIHLPVEHIQKWHNEMHMSVLIFDYPGYGKSEGNPSEQGCYEAAELSYKWLTDQQYISADTILIVGRSLGTAVAVHLAAKYDHQALVLVSPFTSLPDAVGACYPIWPAQYWMTNQFDSMAKINKCSRPILMFHGTKDNRVPIALGKQLFDSASKPKRFITVTGADHGDAVLKNFYGELKQFLQDEVKN